MQAIALVGIFADAGSRIDTVVRFEVLGELINIDRLDVTANGVLHFDAITRILKSNPLHTVVVLAYNKRCSSRNRTWCYAFVSEKAVVEGQQTYLVQMACLARSVDRP